MNSPGFVLAFFGDAEAARSALAKLKTGGYRRVSLLTRKNDGKIAVQSAQPFSLSASFIGAGLGLAALRLWPNAQSLHKANGQALAAMGAGWGGVGGFVAGALLNYEVGPHILARYRDSLMPGETLLIVQSAQNSLAGAYQILRTSGKGGPATFVERPTPLVAGISKPPLRREGIVGDKIKEFAADLGRQHVAVKIGEGQFLLTRLKENARRIATVTRGLSEAARLDQPVSLSAEWLLDNNYVIQGQINDVKRNLTPKFYQELPALKNGRYAGVPRVYLLASEIVAVFDSRLDQTHLLEFIAAYQEQAQLTMGELWALPLMLRLALVENLRRLTGQLDRRQRERERADFWANRLLAATARDPDKILSLLADLSKEQRTIGGHFADRVVSHLFDEEAALAPVRLWLERKMKAPLAQVSGREQRRQAADGVSVANIVTTLRFLASLDWRECFETLSLVDQMLGQDPTGVYRSMDFATRDRYRHEVERIAKGAKIPEIAVAGRAVEMAAQDIQSRVETGAAEPEPEHFRKLYQPSSHIGFYLIDDGQTKFEKAAGYPRTFWRRTRRWMRLHPIPIYLGAIGTGTLGALYSLRWLAQRASLGTVSGALPLPLRLLALLPASEVAVQVVNYSLTRLVAPRPLPKLEFEKGVPELWKTIIVVPMMISSIAEAQECARQLEIHYLSNPDPNLCYALLSDFTDAAAQILPEDAEKLEAARVAIEDLNARYQTGRFYLFHRARRWSETENRWMGWERKRGKLEQLNSYLLGRRKTAPDELHSIAGNVELLRDIRFVITLDADTQLPHGAAKRLIETLAHPLNRPVLDLEGKNLPMVRRGYSIIQPRVDTMLPSATATRFSRLYTDASGSDPYTHAVSDVYQDVFAEGSYHGKGIYDLEAFHSVLDNRFPETTLLSHDLLEGAYVRVGLASDIVLLDKFPPHYRAYSRRDHRWIRGDWQIMDWVSSWVPSSSGKSPNPLSVLNRWKVFDNLRRALLAPASVVMLIGGWFLGPSAALAASAGVGGLLLAPTAINVFTRLTTQPGSLIPGRYDIGRGLLRAGLDMSFLLYRASLCLDATARVFYRRFVSHRLLLEWQTASSTFKNAGAEENAFALRLSLGSALSLGLAALLFPRSALVKAASAPYLLAWATAPFALKWLGKEAQTKTSGELGEDETLYLRSIARQIWRYFDDFVGPQTNWLPPDNYQESLNVEIAQRTSPTNMGLWLLACVSANDFGWLPLDEVTGRTRRTLQTFDELEKHNGHLLNWYNSLTLEPLQPRYVSTVDSGNLLGSLWALARSMKDLSRKPLIDVKALMGLEDALGLLESALAEDKSKFSDEISAVRALLQTPPANSGALLATLRTLEAPISALSHAISTRPLATRASERAKSDISSQLSDPRIAIAPSSYWAAQLETQLDLWLQTANRYTRWIELLSGQNDQFWAVFGPDTPKFREELLETVPSLQDLARGNVPAWNSLVQLRKTSRLSEVGRGEGEVEVEEVERVFGEIETEFGRSRWLAGEMLAQAEGVNDAARGLADGMEMGFLYDRQRKLFSIGYSVEERRLDASFYDLLASECRLASFCAVARGDVPIEHWVSLGRRFGETPVGPALMSWSGTMFEYLMPLLFQRAFENSLLERAVRIAVRVQMDYGRRMNVPWGISESAFSAIDANRTYQYKAFGVPSLGLKRGLENDLVVAPYATLMALMVDRDAALANLRVLQDMGMRGDYGFYESIDFTRERLDEDVLASMAGDVVTATSQTPRSGERGAIVRAFMVHHQGMALLALGNTLFDNVLQNRFHSDAFVQAAEPLLFEKIPEAPPVLTQDDEERPGLIRVEGAGVQAEIIDSPNTPTPRAHLLGNENFNEMITAAGGGYLRWGKFEINRWRSDTARDNWGSFLYLRDLETSVAWSAAHHPMRRPARRSSVAFKGEKVEFDRRDAEIETRLEVVISPQEAAEVRRLTLINHSNRTRKLELTSFLELSLAPHEADRAHPAFNKLFIQTGVIPERDALIAWRRLRKPSDEPVWATHLMSSPHDAEAIEFETDRARFLGCDHSARNPASLRHELSGTVGAVLDPCFALRRRVTLHPGQRLQVMFVTGAAESEEKILHLVEKFSDFAASERVFDLAWTHSQLELRHLRVLPDEAAAFQQLGGHLLYPHRSLRAPARRIRDNQLGQKGLWAYGISGDLPIMIVAISSERDLGVVRQALMAHTFWRVHGLKCDLVILNEQSGGYNQDLSNTLKNLVEALTPYTGTEKPGGVFLRLIDNLPPEDLTLLYAVARVVLVAARGNLAQQLGAISDDLEMPPRFAPSLKESEEPTLALPFLELPYFNGLGGFTGDGREYAIYLPPGKTTPAPWINVFAHPDFGSLISEAGQGFTWFGNSQAYRLTPWSNDPTSDTPAEAIYLRDEETGAFWTPTPLPIRGSDAYRARHGQGYSVHEHNSHGLESELTTFVPMPKNAGRDGDKKAPAVRVQRLKLTNRSHRRRKILATFYGEWVLGTTREENQMQVVTSWDTESGSLLARNAYHPDFGERYGFVSSTPETTAHSADRIAFLGRNGTPASPAAMRRKIVPERTGAGLDPCAVLQVPLELEPNETKEVSFLLGSAASIEEVREIVNSLRDARHIEAALQNAKSFWDEVCDSLQIDVPDLAVNFLVNRWLPYQVLSCRIWARSAFYQSGGAWGFRDQLQDSLAMLLAKPEVTREQILRCAAHQFSEGDVQHWWHPPSDAGVRTLITDDLLFLPYAVAQYVQVTGDTAILGEEIPFLKGEVLGEDEHEKYFQPEISSETASLFEHCQRAIEKGSTFGPNGLPLIGGGDWNDGLNRVGIEGRGESGWLAWFLAVVLRDFAEVCKTRGEAELAKTYRARAKKYATNMDKNGWDGEWYRRGYFDNGDPLGSHLSDEAQIDSLPQSWSILAGNGDPERAAQALVSLEKHLVKREDKMILLFTPAFDQTKNDPGYIKGYLPGVRENGGQYTHAALWTALAFARDGQGTKATQLLRMLNPVEHARTPEDVEKYKVEPYVVVADIYALENAVGRGGWSWYTGSCGWMYRVWVEEVLGVQKQGDKLRISPSIPSDWPSFKLRYRFGATFYEIEVVNPDGVENGVVSVKLDDKMVRNELVSLKDDGETHQVLVTMGEKATGGKSEK